MNPCNTFRDKLVFYLMRQMRYSGISSSVNAYTGGATYKEAYMDIKFWISTLSFTPIILVWVIPVVILFGMWYFKFTSILELQSTEYEEGLKRYVEQ